MSREEKDVGRVLTADHSGGVRLPLWLNRAHREEVAGPKLGGGGDTREEVGVAAVPITLGVYREEDAKGQT